MGFFRTTCDDCQEQCLGLEVKEPKGFARVQRSTAHGAAARRTRPRSRVCSEGHGRKVAKAQGCGQESFALGCVDESLDQAV